MVASAKILETFVSDALKLCARARECVTLLTEQASQNRVSPGEVRSFYQLIHTLKGTAAMVDGCKAVVQALEKIEGRLTCQPVLESAKKYDWIPLARECVEESNRLLLRIQMLSRMEPVLQAEPRVKGMMIKTMVGGKPAQVWFPLSCISQAVPPEKLNAVDGAVYLEGHWLPVLGQGMLGAWIEASLGRMVIRYSESLGLMSWSEAEKLGAVPGLDFLSSKAA